MSIVVYTLEYAHEAYLLAKELFKHNFDDTIDDFESYQGWIVIHNNKLVAFLLYTFIESKYYIEFIGSTVKGCGTRSY